ncbi:unnamed protein product [Menidia menidia]|uniref:(Atlantic silverside) hypothetical protein n=1 Tax=Menidia menidia TaxID=238744 RepID=A0A8S4C0G8_9TELE|nr:unnamed protein product [Menidia menidia]
MQCEASFVASHVVFNKTTQASKRGFIDTPPYYSTLEGVCNVANWHALFGQEKSALVIPAVLQTSWTNLMDTTSAANNREDYRIVQEIPSDSSDDDYSDDSDDEWLPKNNRDIGNEDDEGEPDSRDAESQDADSQDGEGQDDEGQDAENGQHDEGAVENVHVVPAQRNVRKTPQAREYVWKLQDNDFDGDLLPFLGDWRVNVQGREPIDFFSHLFPIALIDESYETNMYALQKGKENLAVTSEEMHIFLGINMVMGYIRYPRARMYWSSEDGLRLGIIADAMSVNRYEQILSYLHFVNNYTYQPANTDRLFKEEAVAVTSRTRPDCKICSGFCHQCPGTVPLVTVFGLIKDIFVIDSSYVAFEYQRYETLNLSPELLAYKVAVPNVAQV